MISLTIKKGYNLNVSGQPSSEVSDLKKPDRVALLPGRILFIKPKLLVKEGDEVNIGTPLFFDKRDDRIQFLSPGGGTVQKIHFGPRRVIQEIVIHLSDKEKKESFIAFSENQINAMDRTDLVKAILNGGLWHVLKALPFRDTAAPETIPPAIWVCLDNNEPFHPASHMYLDGKTGLFRFGLAVLKRLSESVCVSVATESPISDDKFMEMVTHQVSGPYPAHDPGVLVYHTKTHQLDNRSWSVTGQDLLLIAELLKTGVYPIERLITVAGSLAHKKYTARTRIGAPVAGLMPSEDHVAQARIVAGGVLSGYTVSHDSYVGFYETALTALPKGGEKEFLGFARPGIKKHSYSRTFLSVFNRKPLDMDCGMHGEERACVNCSSCANVCPVDILPQFTMKAIHAGEVEEALDHGLLDCVTCGLCSYVCPSKIELSTILENAKRDYYKESM
ncbi:MAG: Na(+)-translocating NADH-quinone reductase subunit A [Proteobacteria bacterium]|nr:Na(+)-translocating NADH-quinone reductase subunit A [Pseudomonadota bacterium]